MSDKNKIVRRLQTSHSCMSQIVIHGNTVYLAGQTYPSALGEREECHLDTSTVTGQTTAILQRIDRLLVAGGTDKTHLITAQVWLKDIHGDLRAMNHVWCNWIDPQHKPVRATVQATLSSPEMLVEIQVTAALPEVL